MTGRGSELERSLIYLLEDTLSPKLAVSSLGNDRKNTRGGGTLLLVQRWRPLAQKVVRIIMVQLDLQVVRIITVWFRWI